MNKIVYFFENLRKHGYIIIFYIIPCAVCVFLCYDSIKDIVGEKALSIGVGANLFLGFVFATLAVISMVSTYREISRLHNSKRNDELSKGIQNLLDEMYKDVEKKAKEMALEKTLKDSFNEVIRELAKKNNS